MDSQRTTRLCDQIKAHIESGRTDSVTEGMACALVREIATFLHPNMEVRFTFHTHARDTRTR